MPDAPQRKVQRDFFGLNISMFPVSWEEAK